jgi:hypothetical protein
MIHKTPKRTSINLKSVVKPSNTPPLKSVFIESKFEPFSNFKVSSLKSTHIPVITPPVPKSSIFISPSVPLPPFSAALCAICKYEDLYIDEWIKYNLSIGFDVMHLYDNSDEFTLRDIPAKYPGKVFVKHFPGIAKQYPAYNDFVVNNRGKYYWVAFVDCDEFIVLRKHTSILDFLKEYCNHPTRSAIALNWYLFGSNGHKTYKPEYVTKRFTRRQAFGSKYVKTIAKLNDITYVPDAHYVNSKYGTYDVNGNRVKTSLNPKGTMDIACIHHYHVKSEEEYKKKIARGRAVTSSKRTFAEFKPNDVNQIEDLTLYNYKFNI